MEQPNLNMGSAWDGKKSLFLLRSNEFFIPSQYHYSFFTDSSRELQAEETTECVYVQLLCVRSKKQTMSVDTELMKTSELPVG